MEHEVGTDRTDEELLAAALSDPGGQQARWAASRLLARYQGRVYAWCYRHLRDPERALDVAQEVLLSAYRNLASFGGRSRFSSWLFAIARNRCLSEQRRPQILHDQEADLDELAARGRDPEQVYLDRQDEEAVLSLIRDHLEPREQEALWLRCFERMPVDTITEILGITEASGARAVLQRARRRLRAALQERRRVEGMNHG
jgi:RNA polymerase sigma-70 factor (ECF subfamily)